MEAMQSHSLLNDMLHLKGDFTMTSLSNVSKSDKNGIISASLLAGPKMSGKTSLLFEMAFHFAENGEYVLFIASKSYTKLPFFVNGREQPSSAVLRRIKIMYLTNYDDLIKYFANIPLLKELTDEIANPCRRILVDDFDKYFQNNGGRFEDIKKISKCIAYMVDTLSFW